jgi:CRP-like cAMP-binding protein
MQEQKQTYLSNKEVFRDVSPRELKELERYIRLVTHPVGKLFYMSGDRGQVLFFLATGRVQQYRITPNGKKLVTVTLGPDSLFGEMTLVGQAIHNTFTESIEERHLYVVGRADYERLLYAKPPIAFRLAEAMVERLKDLGSRLEEIAFKSVPSRLASLLLRSIDEIGKGTELSGFSHQDLSEMLGSYRETVTQTLNDFKARGLIDIGRRRITLLDRSGLEFLAAT